MVSRPALRWPDYGKLSRRRSRVRPIIDSKVSNVRRCECHSTSAGKGKNSTSGGWYLIRVSILRLSAFFVSFG